MITAKKFEDTNKPSKEGHTIHIWHIGNFFKNNEGH
jgi:hypothetical protein